MAKFTGERQLSGTHGKLWWNGELVAEIMSMEATVTANREDVQVGMDVDSKIVSLTGTGTMTLKKAYSRGKKAMLQAWRNGEDTRHTLHYDIKDPGAEGKQRENGTLNNVAFDNIIITNFEQGGLMEEEMPFRFTPSDVEIEDEIQI